MSPLSRVAQLTVWTRLSAMRTVTEIPGAAHFSGCCAARSLLDSAGKRAGRSPTGEQLGTYVADQQSRQFTGSESQAAIAVRSR
jgi:hypothetical protein